MTREDGGGDPSPHVTRCYPHGVDELVGADGVRCEGCGHGFFTGRDLVAAFNRDVVNALSRTRNPDEPPPRLVTDPGEVPFCPVCLHDL